MKYHFLKKALCNEENITSSFFYRSFYDAQNLYASGSQNGYQDEVGRVTGLPIPRFVSLKGKKTYMRHGPSKSHAIMWEYNKRGLPVEVINEYDHWRKIRDMDGSEGWIHQTVLSGRRTIVTLEGTHIVRDGDGYTFDAVAQISGGMVLRPEQCKDIGVKLNIRNLKGGYLRKFFMAFMKRSFLMLAF